MCCDVLPRTEAHYTAFPVTPLLLTFETDTYLSSATPHLIILRRRAFLFRGGVEDLFSLVRTCDNLGTQNTSSKNMLPCKFPDITPLDIYTF